MTRSMYRAFVGLVLIVLAAGCGEVSSTPEYQELFQAPPVPNEIDGVVFRAGDWEPHLAAGDEGSSWGNHRAVVSVEGLAEAAAVSVTIPWRRRDVNPEAKSVIVVDAASGEPVENVITPRIGNASGQVTFQPNPGSTEYYVYYMPWTSTGGYYPEIAYPDPVGSSDPAWSELVGDVADLPEATVTHIESVDDFHSFFPMEVVATDEEVDAFMAGAPGGWRVVPEHRDRPIRMQRALPWHWTAQPVEPVFESRVLKDEAFTFQVGLVAGDEPLHDVSVVFEGFPDSWTESLTCFNCGGVDLDGQPFEKSVSVAAGAVQALWLGVLIPVDQPAGLVEGTVRISTADRGERAVAVALDVTDARAENHGYDDPELQTRLRWLNSTAGTDPDFIIEPFTPVEVEGNSLSILRREIALDASGFPDRILSYYTPELTDLAQDPEDVIAEPIRLVVEVAGTPEAFVAERPAQPEHLSRGAVRWEGESQSERFDLNVEGLLEYDGALDYRIRLIAREDVQVEDISLPVAYDPGAATYMLGLGRRGGRTPDQVDWTWAVENHQEGVWLGGVHKGLGYVLRDENYVRPLNTNFYRNQPLEMPPSWFNEGKGGIRIRDEGSAVRVTNYSGTRQIQAGDTLNFNVRFLVTPFKPIDTGAHFDTRFVHRYVPVDSVQAWGGTVVNIHHANEINPYINYPFYSLEAQSDYIEEAHGKGIKVKLYNTIRELSYKAHELFPMRSLGDEIFNTGDGGGHSWMQEHLGGDYHSAWHAWRVDDAALLNKGTSRWTNYYIEGLGWLAENQEIDGLYLDDIAFSRSTVKRMVSVLHEHRDEVVIDLHSANQYNERDGFINSALLYMEHFPFISRLWFGEYFEYDRDQDYWMTEVAGLPFGLMGEMLQDGGHPYRGMLYGMTTRMYGDVDPRPVWQLMNDFGISESRMLGYWLEDAPVETGNPEVLATTYVRPEGVLIALASWSDSDEVVALSLDEGLLGVAVAPGARIPEVDGLQAEGPVDLSAVRVPANQGLFVLIER